MPTASEIQSFIDKLSVNMARFDGILNGPVSGPSSLITVDSGDVKSVARVLDDLFATGTRFYNTITQVQGLTVPIQYSFIFISGRSASGTGGQYYVRKTSSSHPFKFSDGSGAIWEPTSDAAMLAALSTSSGGITIGVGTTGDYPDFQTAAHAMRPYQVNAGQKIIMSVVSPVTRGWWSPQGIDDSKFVIVNGTGNPAITLDAGFQGVSDVGMGGNERTDNLIAGFYSTLPVLGCVIDMGNQRGSGYYGIQQTRGMVLQNCGVINAGYNGMEMRGSSVTGAYKSRWDGANQSGIRLGHTAHVAAQSATANNCCQNVDSAGSNTGAVDVSRTSTLHFRDGSAINSGAAGMNVRRTSHCTFEEANFSGAANCGIIYNDVSTGSGFGVIVDNAAGTNGPGYGVWVRGGKVDLQGAFIRNNAGADIRIGDSSPQQSGADVDATSVTTTSGLNKVADVLGVDRFSLPGRYGIVNNAAVPSPLSIGVYSSTGASRGWEWDNDFHFARSSAATTGSSTHAQFRNPNGEIGVITTTGTATQFTSLSDARQKVNVEDAMIDIESWIDAIRVRQYDMLSSSGDLVPDSRTIGLVAQELYPLAPRAVTVGGGEFLTESFVPWGTDEGKVVPYLILSVQHLLAEVRSLRLQIEGES